MKTYTGSCHCGQIRFEVQIDLTNVIECNCSMCRKKGVLHHVVAPEQFRFIAGEDVLALYQFNTNTARHYFCPRCGIHPFSRPRVAPDRYSVNVRCLDGVEPEMGQLRVLHFDGRNWEKAVETFDHPHPR